MIVFDAYDPNDVYLPFSSTESGDTDECMLEQIYAQMVGLTE